MYLRRQVDGLDDERGWRQSVDERERDEFDFTLLKNRFFSDQNLKCEKPFVYGKGARRTDWKRVATRARANERADWDKALWLP